MYIDYIDINISEVTAMAVQIANPVVVGKIEQLAKTMGLSKTAAVEKAVDSLLREASPDRPQATHARMDALLAQLDDIPDRIDAFDPLEWDEHGLPR